jgi:hypothetical protein
VEAGQVDGVPVTALSYNILVRACGVDFVGSAAAQIALLAGFLSQDAGDSDVSTEMIAGPGGLEVMTDALEAVVETETFRLPPFVWPEELRVGGRALRHGEAQSAEGGGTVQQEDRARVGVMTPGAPPEKVDDAHVGLGESCSGPVFVLPANAMRVCSTGRGGKGECSSPSQWQAAVCIVAHEKGFQRRPKNRHAPLLSLLSRWVAHITTRQQVSHGFHVWVK